MLSNAHMRQWLAGMWIPVKVAGLSYYIVRRQERGQVITDQGRWLTEGKAQDYADLLNQRDGRTLTQEKP